MRDIKFRAWVGKMEYDITTGKFGTFFVNKEKGDGLHPNDSASLTPNTTKYSDDTPVMQYTGLKDKNGKEIYEGDIVRVTRTNWYCPGHPKHNTDLVDQEEVYWDEKRNAMSARTFDFERLKVNPNQAPYSSSGYLGNGWNDERADQNIVEIIGNIYENPELLTKDNV